MQFRLSRTSDDWKSGKKYTQITLESLEDLLRLVEAQGEIIIAQTDEKTGFTLEIYDDWRE